MDSPTSSEVLLFSEDDSGLLVNGSFPNSSASGSTDERSPRCKECDKSLSMSQEDSLINDSDTLYTQQFNTLKKCPDVKKLEIQIQPPAEFQDSPHSFLNVYSPPLEFKDNLCQHICSPVYTNNYMIGVEQYANDFVKLLISDSLRHLDSLNNTRQLKQHKLYPNLGIYWKTNHRLPIGSNNSLLSSISSSHNSLFNVVSSDDSNFITSAVSHDALNSDTYTLPVNSSPFNVAFRRPLRKKRKLRNQCHSAVPFNKKPIEKCRSVQEPTHMTVKEVRTVLHNIYSNTEECNKLQVANVSRCSSIIHNDHDKENYVNKVSSSKSKIRKHSLMVNIKHKKVKDNCALEDNGGHSSSHSTRKIFCSSPFISSAKSNFSFSLKQTFCNIFRSRKSTSTDSDPGLNPTDTVVLLDVTKETTFEKRALPPVPNNGSCGHTYERETSTDFATSIEKVKDYGWYWGPISGEAAEKILSNEPDGSFIVRDSSDDHYIFSLTFKLNGFVRHVRIEHDQGNFSFGSCTKFKSHTIVEFVENAVEHSRSGRYLFFLHRRPVLGPMRVQLLHPVSRFKQIQSLQHMCRFVILKTVRRDLIHKLPIPRRLTDYLNSPHYYCEQLGSTDSSSSSTPTPAVHLISFTPS